MKRCFLILALGLSSIAAAQKDPWEVGTLRNLDGLQFVWSSHSGSDGEELTKYAVDSFRKVNIPLYIFTSDMTTADMIKKYSSSKPLGLISLDTMYDFDDKQTAYFFINNLTITRTATNIAAPFIIYNDISKGVSPYSSGKANKLKDAKKTIDALINFLER